MKAVFYHDTRLSYDGIGNYYTSNGLTSGLFKKYLEIFNKMTVVTRRERIDNSFDVGKYSTSNCKGVTFSCIDKLSVCKLFFGQDRWTIKNEMQYADLTIIRMPSIIGIVACMEATKSKKPYVIEMVGCPWDTLWNYGKLRYKFMAPIIFICNKLLIKAAPNVIYVSEFLQKRYPTNGNACICSDVHLKIKKEDDLYERLSRIHSKDKREPYTIGTVATVNMRFKGQRYVIEAIARLREEGYNFEYYLAGDGDNKELLDIAKMHHVDNAVHFVGTLSHVEVFKFMKKNDVYVQPSVAEGQGRVILEAFSLACPVIGSSAGGIPELIDSKYIFKKKNVDSLITKLRMIIANNELETQAIRNFKEVEKYNPNNLQLRRAAFYKKAAGEQA